MGGAPRTKEVNNERSGGNDLWRCRSTGRRRRCGRFSPSKDDEFLPAQPLVQSQITGISGEGAHSGRSVALSVRNLETLRPQRRRQPKFRFLRFRFRIQALRFFRQHQAPLYLERMPQKVGRHCHFSATNIPTLYFLLNKSSSTISTKTTTTTTTTNNNYVFVKNFKNNKIPFFKD